MSSLNSGRGAYAFGPAVVSTSSAVFYRDIHSARGFGVDESQAFLREKGNVSSFLLRVSSSAPGKITLSLHPDKGGTTDFRFAMVRDPMGEFKLEYIAPRGSTSGLH